MNKRKYVKRCSSYKTLDDYIVGKTGRHISDLNKYQVKYNLPALKNIADRIMNAVHTGKRINVYADYDCDGISSVDQFIMLLQALQANFSVKVPKRFTDGYGIKPEYAKMVEPNSLLILVDNGIAALEAVEIAKSKNVEVIIMDHHMAFEDDNDKIIYPKADILLDPEAIPENNDYCDYCGAGLTYKLAQYMLPNNHPFMDICASFAAIGTVADMVPLTEDNRQIVQRGLDAMNSGKTTAGLLFLIDKLGISGHVTSEKIAYYLAPILNASGRLYDDGATWAAQTLLETNQNKVVAMVNTLVQINEMRKTIVAELMKQVYIDPNDKVNVICTPDNSPLGCLGLVAGKITEATKRTTFVYTNTGTILKGSARSDDENKNHVKKMLDSIKQYMTAYGGHPGAAGFSFNKENEQFIREKLLSYPVQPHDMTPYYDLDVRPQELSQMLEELDRCEPFGKNIERPTFAINCQFGNSGEYWRVCGAKREHITFNIPGTNYKAIAFGMKERYMKDGYPKNIRLIGNIVWNYYMGSKKPQFLVDDYEIM